MLSPAVVKIRENPNMELYLIDLPQEMPGFRNFIAAWLLVTPASNYLVDPGPAASISLLLQALEKTATKRLDYILLTHLHLDHAGGTGHLLEHFPQAKVLAHPRGRRHLLDPSALWQGSLEVLGEIGRNYGEMRPVPETNLVEVAPGVEVIATPGHAPHHLSFLYGDILWAGETAGVYQNAGGLYLRPATPPRFFFDVAVASVDRLLGLPLEGKTFCHGHYGAHDHASEILTLHRQQLFLWKKVITGIMANHPHAGEAEMLSLARQELLQRDPLLVHFADLPPDIQQREEYFILNSLKGLAEI